MYKLIHDTYYSPVHGLQSAAKLYDKLKHKGVKLKDIKAFIANQETYQLNKQATKINHYFPIVAKEENEIFQVDLADMSDISTTNNNYKWILCVIDVFTRKAYVMPLKNKTSANVTAGMKQILNKSTPLIINCDNGSEFTSSEFKTLAKDHNIDVRYVPVGDHHKLAIIDRFIRTLRTMINNYQTAYNTTKYITVLDKLVKNYNNSYHSGIKGIPNKPDYGKLDLLNQSKYKKALAEETKYNIGQSVRFLKNPVLFQKGTQPRWSESLHRITDKTEHTYTLDNDKIYKYYELMPVKYVQQMQMRTTRQKEKEPSRELLKKVSTSKRRMAKEGISMSNILTTKRSRKPTDKFSY